MFQLIFLIIISFSCLLILFMQIEFAKNIEHDLDNLEHNLEYLTKTPLWEYKVIKISGSININSVLHESFSRKFIEKSKIEMNMPGPEWELVSAIPEIETVHPNFGKFNYVTGIQPNTRTADVILIFRKKK